MHYTGRKGWQANLKDTWSLEHTLSPIIGAALVKYKETITGEGSHRKGLPSAFEEACVEEGLVVWEDEESWVMTDESFDACMDKFLEMIDDCIYAFTKEQPDISKYDFHYDFISEATEESVSRPFTMECSNKEESARYDEDMKTHNERVQKGHELFGKYLSTTWW